MVKGAGDHGNVASMPAQDAPTECELPIFRGEFSGQFLYVCGLSTEVGCVVCTF